MDINRRNSPRLYDKMAQHLSEKFQNGRLEVEQFLNKYSKVQYMYTNPQMT